ncbi:MAG: hypothetical protein U0166_02485 [Acidobacteriota bacterium]
MRTQLLTASLISTLSTICLASSEPKEIAVAATRNGWDLVAIADDGTLRVSDGAGTVQALPFLDATAGAHRSWPVAASDGASVFVAWVEGGAGGSRIMSATFAASGVPRTLQVSGNTARWARFPSIAVSPDGVPWVAWVDGSMGDDNIVVSRFEGGVFTRPERVSAPDATEDLVPQIAFDLTGTPVVVWSGRVGEALDDVLWSRRDGQMWSPEARLHAENQVPDVTPALGRDGTGNLWVAWSSLEDKTAYQVFAARLDGKAWLPTVRVSQGTGAATLPRIVGAEDGVVVLWNQNDGAASAAEARLLDGHGAVKEIAFPSRAEIGRSSRPVAFYREHALSLVSADGAAVSTVVAKIGR